jgi:hypothetical protein
VNGAVNGGTKVFEELFFESDLKNAFVMKRFTWQQKSAFADEQKAINIALRVHCKMLTKEYLPQHKNIRVNIVNMREVIESGIGKINLTARLSFAEIASTAFKKFEAESPIRPPIRSKYDK